jgi:hypothetical protein
LSSGFVLAFILAFSASLNDPRLCDRLIGLGAPAKACEGVLEYRSPPPSEALASFAGRLDDQVLITLAFIAALVVVPLYIFLLGNADRSIQPLRVVGLEMAVLLFSVPLFALAVDWGRWVSMHVILATVTCALFLPRRGKQRVARATGAGSALALIAGLLVLGSMLTWSVNYCCGSDIVRPLGPLDAIAGAWEDFGL